MALLFSRILQPLLWNIKEDKNMAKRLTKIDVKKDIVELYKNGWSPEEIMLMFRSSSKTDDEVERFVMRAIKPLFN